MIFISHNYKDKGIVEPIALRLALAYGQDNVFYDSWSIQPGEGIVDRMEEGLKACKFFFFFVSENSLKSNMVKLEWQNALMRKANNGNIKFIPVRLDRSELPFLLTQTLYIDLFTNGLEFALRQMSDVIEKRNTFKPNDTFSNLKAYKTITDDEITIECRAEYFFEPVASFLFLSNNNLDNVEADIVGEVMQMNYSPMKVELSDGSVYNAIKKNTNSSISPGFPIVIRFSSNDSFDIVGVMHETQKGKFTRIPLVIE